MTVGDLIKKAQEADRLPEGATIPQATLRVGSGAKRIMKLERSQDVELRPDDADELAAEERN